MAGLVVIVRGNEIKFPDHSADFSVMKFMHQMLDRVGLIVSEVEVLA